MVEFTEAARGQIVSFLARSDEELALRVRVRRPGVLAPEYDLLVVEADDREAHDVVQDAGGFRVFIDPAGAPLLAGVRIDWAERRGEAGFVFHPPGGQGSPEPLTGTLEARVRRVIAERINPGVASHGGRVTLEALRDGVAYLRMGGGCQGCGLAGVTLEYGIQQVLLDAIPELAGVEDVTDHAAGVAPYVSPAEVG